MRKISKILVVLLIFFIFVNMFGEVFATINPDNYQPSQIGSGDTEIVFSKVGVILGAIRNISVIVSVIALMIIGLKYIFGSVEEKAEYKKTMVPYVIGCILASAGTTLVSFIYNAMNS